MSQSSAQNFDIVPLRLSPLNQIKCTFIPENRRCVKALQSNSILLFVKHFRILLPLGGSSRKGQLISFMVSCYEKFYKRSEWLLRKEEREIPFTLQIIAVSCGGSHTVAIDESGRAFSFGQSSNGQLGLTTRILESFEPARIKVSTSAMPQGTSNRCVFKRTKVCLYI